MRVKAATNGIAVVWAKAEVKLVAMIDADGDGGTRGG